MNELKDLYKILKVPAYLNVTGKDTFHKVRQSYNHNGYVIVVANNLLSHEADERINKEKFAIK